MNFRQKITLHLLLYFTLSSAAFAQVVDIPDPNLQRAVRSALNLQPNQPITSANLQHLERLVVNNRLLPEDEQISNLTGLEHAIQLEHLVLAGNNISDLTPLQNLVGLRHLALGGNNISDIRPLANLVELRDLHLTDNKVSDVSPLSRLVMLRKLILANNAIEDLTPLTNLTNVVELDIRRNPATDYSALTGIPYLVYDEYCEMEPLPVWDRIANRDYPSIAMPWGGDPEWHKILDRPDLTPVERIALHDLWLLGGLFKMHTKETPTGLKLVGDMSESIGLRDQYLAINPNLIFLKAVGVRELPWHYLPPDSPFWVRDENGNIVPGWQGNGGLYDFTNPEALDRILAEVRAFEQCGLFDGVFFDWWNDNQTVLSGWRTLEEEQRARATIMRFIRTELRPDFLVFVNGGGRIVGPLTGPMANGNFMETVRPADKPQEDMPEVLVQFATTLSWSESTMRIPRINTLEGWANPNEPPDSPVNLRWMRAFTTLSLTHSDGYTLFTDGIQHRHMWYDFWDADLGRPVGEKGELYQETEGLYIREFTNGWAVYNNSGSEQEITLPELTVGVASSLEGLTHTLPDLDGEMYLRVKPANPADVNGDGLVNILDLVLVAQAFGKDGLQGDVNEDGIVNVFDLVQVAAAIGGGGAAPSAHSLDLSIISAADVAKWLALAQGLGGGDPNFQRGVRFLQQLLAVLTPKETTLLPNYPNPFNPETWIPYRLAREGEVTITIYDTNGTLVRRLALGNQATGYYAERGKAAYWDGRNERGEAVASGIYIYQFRAGDYAASRRMVIVK